MKWLKSLALRNSFSDTRQATVTCWVYMPPGMACSEEVKRFTRDAVEIIFSK